MAVAMQLHKEPAMTFAETPTMMHSVEHALIRRRTASVVHLEPLIASTDLVLRDPRDSVLS